MNAVPTASGLLDMLSRAQCSRVDDQRGLLTKEQLEVPQFLQLPSQLEQDTEPNRTSTTSSAAAEPKQEAEEATSPPSNPAGAAKETPNSAKPKSKDLKETTVW